MLNDYNQNGIVINVWSELWCSKDSVKYPNFKINLYFRYYTRLASMARHIYIRAPVGVATMTKIYGGKLL